VVKNLDDHKEENGEDDLYKSGYVQFASLVLVILYLGLLQGLYVPEVQGTKEIQ
jgi:hypothetical protein